MSREIEVWGDWQDLGAPVLMGHLRSSLTRGKEVFSFSYDEEWLASPAARQLDPELQLFEGPQYPRSEERPNFGLFLDSSPDRWGRLLMQRREAALARKAERSVRRLVETDYLLGVHDEQRSGALRFKEPETGDAWLNNDPSMCTPPWTSLRELEHASWMIQDDAANEDPHYLEWLSVLIAPGSSIGGARPKAGVTDPQGDLWIAKFPGRSDSRDIAAWEMLTHQLAVAAGLRVAEAGLHQFGDGHRTFMTRRFDRISGTRARQRVHFASAMTLLGHTDGDDPLAGASYLEFVDFLTRQGAQPNQDLEELWRRIVFSIAVHNTDDHLRNHGFLLTESGWLLSPAYDLNPDPHGAGLSLNISETDNALSFDLAIEVAPFFRLKAPSAEAILWEVKKAVADWKEHAKIIGIARAEQEIMAAAFEM
ncbi:MAG: serine/threonine-protein kinase HipA [Verrucomicrobiales bacterium]|jgi:serine/threonine-protein kinase HipA